MTGNPQPKADRPATGGPECSCGLAFRGPWDLTAHLLKACPPSARQPLDGSEHADATRLAVKLSTASPGAWEVVTWASDQHSDLRLAASIAHQVKTGKLKLFDTLLRQHIRDTHHVSMHVVDGAISVLKDYGILRNHGGRNGVACHDIETAIGESFSYGQMLLTLLTHVARLEDEISALKPGPNTAR